MVPFKPIPVLWMKIYYFPLRFSKKVKCGFILHRQWRKLREIASFQDKKNNEIVLMLSRQKYKSSVVIYIDNHSTVYW